MSMNNTIWPDNYYSDGINYARAQIIRSMEYGAQYCLIPNIHPAYRSIQGQPIIPA